MEGRACVLFSRAASLRIEEWVVGVFLVIKIHCLKYGQDSCDTDRTVTLAEDYRKLFHN